MDVDSRQAIAFHVGKRDRGAVWALWQKIPEQYRQQADFYTDLYEPMWVLFPKINAIPSPKAAV